MLESGSYGQDKRLGDENSKKAFLYRMRRVVDETAQAHCTMTATARSIWKTMKLPCLNEMVAESMWRAMGWVCEDKMLHW